MSLKSTRANRKAAAKGSEQYRAAMARRAAQGERRELPQTPKRPRFFMPQISEADQAFIRSLIIHEDDQILALAKPSGLSSQGGRGGGLNIDDLLFAFQKPSGQRPGLVHRLDRDTSGLLLAAKSKSSLSYLGKAMMNRQFAKTYVCLVGNADHLPDEDVIKVPLRREEVGRESYSRICAPDHPEAQSAVTRYKVLDRHEGMGLLQVRPETGRMHQIRVHLGPLGAPIAGDVRYGGDLRLKSQNIRRLMLHAHALAFPHPFGHDCRLVCPVAFDMVETVAALGFTKNLDLLLTN